MTFSIVIPTYNGEDYVRYAVESALNQTRIADEIIISDDNSTDSTIAICKEYGNKVKIFTNPKGPSGFVNSWNNAIAHATCEFISILHQDDLLRPTFLEEAENALEANPDVRHLFSLCDNIDEDENITETSADATGEIFRYTGREYVHLYQYTGRPNVHRCPGVITHRSIFDVCRYREEAGHIADDDFFFHVGIYTNIIGIFKPLAAYRNHDKSETGHLGDIALTRRLLRDYVYQCEHLNDNPVFGEDEREYFKLWRYRYWRRLLGYSIKHLRWDDFCYAVRKTPLWNIRGLFDFRFKNLLRVMRIMLLRSLVRANKKQLDVKSLEHTVLLAPHPDDEIIGCGGLLTRLIHQGKDVNVIIMSDGAGSHNGCCKTPKDEIVKARHQLTLNAAEIIGLSKEKIHCLNFPDGGICNSHPEIERLKGLIDEIKPDVILVPHRGEGWPDHLATREIGLQLAPKTASVWEYCVWFWYYNSWRIAWSKASVLKLTAEEHATKLKAVDAYTLPTAPCGKPWSGVLPKVFLNANKTRTEVYFKVK